MTTLDHRPQPATIDGEVTSIEVHPIPSNPHRLPVYASAGLLAVALGGILANIDAAADAKAALLAGFALALALFLVSLIRFNAFAEANDPFWKP